MFLLLFRIFLVAIQIICLLLMSNSKDVNYTLKTGIMAIIVSMLITGF